MINPVLVQPCLYMAPQDIIDVSEIVEKRRQNSKTYNLGNGQFRVSSRYGAIHYKDNPNDKQETFKEIDLTINENGRMFDAPYSIEVFTDRVGYAYTSKRGGNVEVELVEIGHGNVDNERFKIRREGNQFFWDDVDNDIDLKILLRPLSAEIFKQIKSSSAKRHFRWRIRETKTRQHFRRATFGQDLNKDRLEIVTSLTYPPTTEQYVEYFYDEEWSGRISRVIDKSTRQKEWFNDPSYPVVIDAVTSENIVANVDDGYELNSSAPWVLSTTFAGGNYWLMGYYGAGATYVNGGVRFRTLGIPQGSTINSASITVNVPSLAVGGGLDPQVTIYADDVDDAPVWSNNSRPSQIAQTLANVNFTPTTTGAWTINVTGIVQEIITRPGWSSGYDIRFGFINQAVGAGYNQMAYIYDYNQGQAGAAQLDVNYTPPSVGRIPRDGVTNFQIPGII